MLTEDQIENALIDDMIDFWDNPMGFVMYAYEWETDQSIQMVELPEPWASKYGLKYGPDKWACEFLEDLGKQIREHNFDGRCSVPAIRKAVSSGHGIGKAQGYSSKILTPNGEVLWSSLYPGMFVFGQNGKPVKIIARHEQGVIDLYKVSFNDGTSVCVGLDHLWDVRGRQERRHGLKPWITLPTEEILKRGVKRKNGKSLARQWEIPNCEPVLYPSKKVIVDPYVYGLWLGDGTKRNGAITNGDTEIWEYIKEAGYKLGVNRIYDNRKAQTHTVLGLLPQLKDNGLYGCKADNCKVDDLYKYNDIEIRLSVLQGLLDTDGWIEKSGTIMFGSVSEQLSEDVLWLARSLGLIGRKLKIKKNTFYRDTNGNKVKCKAFYRVSITWDGQTKLFRLPRYQERLQVVESRYSKKWIDSIEFSHKEQAMCITVEAQDGLYLANDFIVTHNSCLTGWLVNFIMSTRPNAQGTVTANTSTQLETKTWPQIAKWTKKCITSHWFRVNTGRGSMKMVRIGQEESWYCSAQTCREENSESFAGQHAANSTSFYINDEGSSIPAAIWEVQEGGLTDGEPMQFVFGNPTKNNGKFYDCFHKQKHRWDTHVIDSRNVQITNKQHLQEMIDDYGIDSDIVKVRIRGLFPSMSLKQFISVEDADAGYGRSIRPEQYKFAPKILTVDPAWEGDDEFVIGLRQGLAFKILRAIQKNDNDLQMATLIANLEDEHKADAVFIDAGYGTGIQSAGKVLHRTHWRIVWFSGASPDKGCLNMRAYMWKQMRDWLKNGGCYPEDQVLHDDLIGPETVFRDDGKLQLESKKAMKARGLPSPGRADVLALSFAYPVNKKYITRGRQKNIDMAEDWNPNDYI